MTLRFLLSLAFFFLLNLSFLKASDPRENLNEQPAKRTKASQPPTLNIMTCEELPHNILERFLGKTLLKEGTTIIRLSLTTKNIRAFIERRCETLDLRGNDLSTGLAQASEGKNAVNLEKFINLSTLNVSGCNLTSLPRLSYSKKLHHH